MPCRKTCRKTCNSGLVANLLCGLGVQANRLLRVLIIEDDRVDREIYKRRLQRCSAWRFEFAESDSAKAGIELSKTWRPDCVLLDFNLPDMDGIEALACLKDD